MRKPEADGDGPTLPGILDVLALIVGLPLLAYFAVGMPLSFDFPSRRSST